MQRRARVGPKIIATLLGAFAVLAVLAGPAAAGGPAAKSGLPGGPGSAFAKLEQQIQTLALQVSALGQLGQDVTALQQQLAAVQQQAAAMGGLQGQVDGLGGRVSELEAQVAALSAQIAALAPSPRLAVFDASNVKVGDVVGVQDTVPWVGLVAAGRSIALRVLPGRLAGGFLWFTGAECAGTPYISDPALLNGPSALSLAAVHQPSGVVYAADANAATQPVSVQSVHQPDGSCYTYPWSFSQNLLTATPVLTLGTAFTPPYSVH